MIPYIKKEMEQTQEPILCECCRKRREYQIKKKKQLTPEEIQAKKERQKAQQTKYRTKPEVAEKQKAQQRERYKTDEEYRKHKIQSVKDRREKLKQKKMIDSLEKLQVESSIEPDKII